jgi:predicted lipoprotein with Yx(FWY)xxD motif
MKIKSMAAFSIAAAAGLLSSSAFAQAIKSTDGLMTDTQGRTLYVFSNDNVNKSNCKGACLAAWPAFVPKAEAKPYGDVGIMSREDGIKQWTHKDRPLYYFAGDARPGDKLGDRQNNVWFVVPYGAEVSEPKAIVSPARVSGY